jgi:hypothetical protein
MFDFLARQLLKLRRRLDMVRAWPTDPRAIPIVINNFNRLGYLKSLISRLEKDGYSQIFILDNASSYPPLLEYYERECRHEVLRLSENLGHLALWKSAYWPRFRNRFYVYTDPDVVPAEDCPPDFMQVFLNALKGNMLLDKVGFSLRIDNLPDSYARKSEVLDHERQFWSRINKAGFFDAPLDTTFALYRPGCKGGAELRSWRSRPPYQALHLPWYEDTAKLNEEQAYYYAHTRSTVHWGKTP